MYTDEPFCTGSFLKFNLRFICYALNFESRLLLIVHAGNTLQTKLMYPSKRKNYLEPGILRDGCYDYETPIRNKLYFSVETRLFQFLFLAKRKSVQKSRLNNPKRTLNVV